MTPEQKIKKTIILKTVEECSDNQSFLDLVEEMKEDFNIELQGFSDEDINCVYDHLYDYCCETKCNFREGEEVTDIECPDSRHYESCSVAAQMFDKTWVGWTYWYGGGKFGDPGAIEWMENAYYLDLKEEEKTVIVKTFSKKDN